MANNTSGFKGIRWYKRGHKWRASICIDGRIIHLGYFTDILDAMVARHRAERKFHPFRVRPQNNAIVYELMPPDHSATTLEVWNLVLRITWRLPPRIHWR